MSKAETVLITGGAGFIGSHTADHLLRQGYRVRVLDYLVPPVHTDHTWPTYLDSAVERRYGSVTLVRDLQEALAGVDYVIHLAAYQDYIPRFAEFARTNVTGTALLYELIHSQSLPIRRVVVASSQAVYGEGHLWCPVCEECGHARHPIPALPRTAEQLRRGEWAPRGVCPRYPSAQHHGEAFWKVVAPVPSPLAPAVPQSVYGVSKLAEEMFALRIGEQYEIPTVALRYSIAQGARQSAANANSGALRNLSSQLLAGQPAWLYEDGGQLRDYVHVDDVARLNVRALTRPGVTGRAWNVGGPRAVMLQELGCEICRQLDLDPNEWLRVTGEYRVGDARHCISDSSSTRAAFDWAPRHDLARNVSDYLAWAREHPAPPGTVAAARRQMHHLGVLRGSAEVLA